MPPKRTFSGLDQTAPKGRPAAVSSKKGKVFCILVMVVVGAVVLWSKESTVAELETSLSSSATGLMSAVGGSGAAAIGAPLERKTIQDVDVLFQRPLGGLCKGILFVGHGCSHSHTDWFPRTNGVCPECLGLPEEMAIVKLALTEYQFGVVAISSKNRERKCWTIADGERVAPVLKEVAEIMAPTSTGDEKQPQVPIVAFGASSGGNFVGATLPDSMEDVHRPLEGYIAQISAPNPRTHKVSEQHPLPVAVYITMNRDSMTDNNAAEMVLSLDAENHPAKHIRLPPLVVGPSFFQDRIEGVTKQQSEQMVKALTDAGYIDTEKGVLKKDPRSYTAWKEAIRPVAPTWDTLVADQSATSEVMNVARAMHELSRDGVKEAMDFIMQQYAERGPAVPPHVRRQRRQRV